MKLEANMETKCYSTNKVTEDQTLSSAYYHTGYVSHDIIILKLIFGKYDFGDVYVIDVFLDSPVVVFCVSSVEPLNCKG